MILFSSGFPLTPERQSELTATIDALNKANIAVYPVDVRGLAASPSPGMDISNPSAPGTRPDFRRVRNCAALNLPSRTCRVCWAALAAPPDPEPQRGGGGGGGGGRRSFRRGRRRQGWQWRLDGLERWITGSTGSTGSGSTVRQLQVESPAADRGGSNAQAVRNSII